MINIKKAKKGEWILPYGAPSKALGFIWRYKRELLEQPSSKEDNICYYFNTI
jgi:hypothetical protein